MLKIGLIAISTIVSLFGHFQMIIPSTDIVEKPGQSKIALNLVFCHPFEGDVMDMVKPANFGVMIAGKKNIDLITELTEYKINGRSAWQTTYQIKEPGDHIFYCEPAPYFEPAEGKFIIHYTKVIVNAFGLEEGWDKELGLTAEIIPLSRSYGLYCGNIFRGIVKINGNPVPFIDVEVEYYNKEKKYTAPAGPFITQIVKTDGNGVFSYAIPKAGWWGFAVLGEAEKKMLNKKDGRYYPIEIGGLIWIKATEMK